MSGTNEKSREVIEILADVVKETAVGCDIVVIDRKRNFRTITCPEINYTFGSDQYVKDRLDVLSKSPRGNDIKFPLIALFCPFEEKRDSSEYFSKATVNILIANSSLKEWNNEERLVYSFQNILRPIYRRLIRCLKEDGRIDFGYEGVVPHNYSENYSYGRYGARTSAGDAVSEPIDAINITNLILKITNKTCR